MSTQDTSPGVHAELQHPQPHSAQLHQSSASAVAPDANDQPTHANQTQPRPAARQLPSSHQRPMQPQPPPQAQPPAAQLLLLQLPTDLLAGRLWALLPGSDRRRLRMACRAAAALAAEELMAHPTVGARVWRIPRMALGTWDVLSACTPRWVSGCGRVAHPTGRRGLAACAIRRDGCAANQATAAL